VIHSYNKTNEMH